jgi:hypothetical protein
MWKGGERWVLAGGVDLAGSTVGKMYRLDV